ncbi:putative phage tail protein [Paraburkholderia sp. BL8N3]|nr:tail assembly protein [Paraburkholderia sp. BL8N3]TCK37968.1 putative phage tail protein [Paraburkholderia sp. BL8N3]
MMTVRLYGDLGARFGRRYLLDVHSPAEAIHALCVQLRGLRQYFLEHATQQFRVRGRQDYDEHDIDYPQCTGTLKIVPLVQGTGAFGKVLGGAALAIVGAVVSAYGAPQIGAGLVSMGIGLALGGVAQMLAPRVKGTATPEKAENTPSLAFDGAVNTMGQGGPVPLGYGRLRVGSQIISVGFSTNNEIVVR